MRIALVSDLETQGGAAISATRLCDGLWRTGCEVIRVVAFPSTLPHPWPTRPLALQPPLLDRALRRLMPTTAQRIVAVRHARRELDRTLAQICPDVISVHNLHGAAAFGWSPELLRVCLQHAPTAWTLHDMWSFTGRCAYSYDCLTFRQGCDASCPTASEYPVLDPARISRAWCLRRQILADHRELVAVSPSQWLADAARKGLWSEHRVEQIPYGVPLDVFSPLERNLARTALGLQVAGPVLLFVAHSIAERRKGITELFAALREVSEPALTVLSLGAGDPPTAAFDPARFQVRSLGFVDHERTRALAYNAADLLVHPAPVDNFPNTILEALACGTPVVAFPVGGVPEMVRPGETGWLAQSVDPPAFARAIRTALTEMYSHTVTRADCRAVAESRYSLSLQAERYVALFRTLMTAETGRGIA